MGGARQKSASVRPLKVLVIEDDADVREAVERRLTAAKSFEVRCSPDGNHGLRSALESPPDVVLLDLAMPGCDGWAVCRALRSDPETLTLPIVVMTARWGAESESLAQAFRVTRVLFKPLDFAALADALKSVL